MKQFIKSFVRDESGAWHCVQPADLTTPQGRVQVTPGTVFTKGTRFMNVDVAELLEEQYTKDRARNNGNT